jgi:hypothetical protein
MLCVALFHKSNIFLSFKPKNLSDKLAHIWYHQWMHKLTRSLLLPYPVRFRALGGLIESSDINVINFQEVFTHRQRRLLDASLPSFGYSTYDPSATGPKGALVTFSKFPIQKSRHESFYSSSRLADRSVTTPDFHPASHCLLCILQAPIWDRQSF